jgi:hypothetical protein
MGMYTEVFFRAELKADTPDDVIETLRYMVGDSDDQPTSLPAHPLFACQRWDVVARCTSAYFPASAGSVLARSSWSADRWSLSFLSSLKNYDGEAEKFFDWIGQYVTDFPGDFLGYTLYEESEDPILFRVSEAQYSLPSTAPRA